MRGDHPPHFDRGIFDPPQRAERMREDEPGLGFVRRPFGGASPGRHRLVVLAALPRAVARVDEELGRQGQGRDFDQQRVVDGRG